MNAQEFVADLVRQLEVEQAPERQLSPAEAGLIGTWHYCGSGAATLPPTGSGTGASGTTVSFGSDVLISAEMLINSYDRRGESELVEMLSSEDAQLAGFGEIRWRRGPWPSSALRVKPGSHESIEQARVERERAWLIADADARTAELQRLRSVYGQDYFGEAARARTVAKYDGGPDREQRPPDAR